MYTVRDVVKFVLQLLPSLSFDSIQVAMVAEREKNRQVEACMMKISQCETAITNSRYATVSSTMIAHSTNPPLPPFVLCVRRFITHITFCNGTCM